MWFRRKKFDTLTPVDKIKLSLDLVKDALSGNYSLITLAPYAIAVLYIFSPLDIVNDYIPLFGQIDDLGIVLLALKAWNYDLMKYSQWRGN